MMNLHSELNNHQHCTLKLIASIRRFFFIFGILSFILIIMFGVIATLSSMKQSAKIAMLSASLKSAQINDQADHYIDNDDLIKEFADTYDAMIVLRDAEGKVSALTDLLHQPILCFDPKSKYEWSFDGLNLIVTISSQMENGEGSLSASVDFMSQSKPLQISFLMSMLLIGVETILYLFMEKKLGSQKVLVESLISTNDKLEKRLYHDGLTEVMTRSMFLIQAEKLLADNQEDRLITLCFVDLDDLKILNDTYGHQAGDIALKRIGSALRGYEKKYQSVVGRYGGDEFVLILRGIKDVDQLNEILAELTKQLRFTISYMGEDLSISCSIGAEVWNQEDDLEILIAKADKALYEIKRHGKGDYLISKYKEKN